MHLERNSPLIRQWLLLRALSSTRQGLTIPELAAEVEVSEKTIRRDLSVFEAAGFPLDPLLGEHGRKRYRLADNAQPAPIRFTIDEAAALSLCRLFLTQMSDTQLWEAAWTALRKVRLSLDERLRDYLDRNGGALVESRHGRSDYRDRAEVIDRLLQAVEERRIVFITYQSARSTEPVTYDVHPYRLMRHRGSLYLQGWKPDDQEHRVWKVDRIESADLERVPFQMPTAAEISAAFDGAFGIYQGTELHQVTVRFSRDASRYVLESQWHPTQAIEHLADGAVQLTFEVSSLVEIKSWILSFGPAAEVLAPAALREEVSSDLRHTLEKYSPQGSSNQDVRR